MMMMMESTVEEGGVRMLAGDSHCLLICKNPFASLNKQPVIVRKGDIICIFPFIQM